MGASGSNPNRDKDQPSTSHFPSDESNLQKRSHILIVEDNQADVFLMREALEIARVNADIHVRNDGEKAVQFFDAADSDPSAPCPAFIILDLNLPKLHGTEVLSHLRQSRTCAKALVLIATSSDSLKDREETTRLGANGYFRKPSAYAAYLKLGDIVRTMMDVAAADHGGAP